MTIIIPANSAAADAGYSIANSCRFNKADDVVMTKTFATPTLRTKFTISFWMKRSKITIARGASIFGSVGGDTSNFGTIDFNPQDNLVIADASGGPDDINLITTRKFRDTSAWYHIVYAIDSTQGTAANRVKLYVNGTQETVFSTATYPDADTEFHFNFADKVHQISKYPYGVYHIGFDGYLAEFFFVDGVAHAASTFGEFDEDSPTIWKPKDCKDDLTFGNNGFYLDFADSGDLGDDESGNSNDFAETNLAATDQTTDTPTNNFATMNVLDNYLAGSTFSEGNCYIQTIDSGNACVNLSTIGVANGKWFWEVLCAGKHSGNNEYMIGVASRPPTGNSSDELGNYDADYGYRGHTGKVRNNGSESTYGNTFADDAIIGVALNLDDNELKFYIDGTVQNSGTAVSISSSPTTGFYYAAGGDFGNNYYDLSFNFGNPAFAISSGNADGNGYGNFEYAVPSGFYALCTKNLAEFG